MCVFQGAIAMMKVPFAEISSCSFLGNSAFDPTTKAAYGGAIHAQESQTIWIGHSEFSLNTAKSGGAIMANTCEDFQTISSSFLGNSALNCRFFPSFLIKMHEKGAISAFFY